MFGAVHAGLCGRAISGRHGSNRLSVHASLAPRQLPAVVIGSLLVLTMVTIGAALAVDADGAGSPGHDRERLRRGPGRPRRTAAGRAGGPPVERPGYPRGRMSGAKFDELIHPSTRLAVVSLLAATDWAEFSYLRDQLALSDSALSKQLSTLEDAGYVRLERLTVERRRRVRVRLSAAGRAAFEGHVAALRDIVERATASGPA